MSQTNGTRLTRNILLSRFLTHSGDQAWDFAVPLALIAIFPTRIALVALYYLLVRLGHVILVTRVCSYMDRWNRLTSIRVGITVQTIGVGAGAIAVFQLERFTSSSTSSLWSDPIATAAFAVIALFGLVGSLGTTMMQVAVSQDWIPTVVPPADLVRVNSRLKQIDLFTELAAPVVAGLVLTIKTPFEPLLGFGLIALFNVVSFFPEYFLLRNVYRAVEGLAARAAPTIDRARMSLVQNIRNGWRDFFEQPAAFSMIAYALLWLTILSPHGVLLTAWLKTEWQMSEAAIGLFRGLGAVFGLLSTLVFPYVASRMSLVATSRAFIVGEAVCLVAAGLAFYAGQSYVVVFAAFILLSRIGLYGFSLGETEIRQVTIPAPVRGRVNGFANALTSLATLGIYGAGALLDESKDFPYLVYGSIVAVGIGALTFTLWSMKSRLPSAIKEPRAL